MEEFHIVQYQVIQLEEIGIIAMRSYVPVVLFIQVRMCGKDMKIVPIRGNLWMKGVQFLLEILIMLTQKVVVR